MYNKIVNPKTNRPVNIDSKLGKQIIMNYYKNLIGGIPGPGPTGVREGNLPDNDGTYTFDYYKTIEEANLDNLVGEVTDLGKLPEEAWFTNNDGILYQVIEYQGNIDKMICRKLGETEKLYELEPFFISIKYWGYMESVPPMYKRETEMRMDDVDDPFDFLQSDEDMEYLGNNIGNELNIGELPLGSWITYKDKLLQLTHYDTFGVLNSTTGNKGFYCKQYSTDVYEVIDSTDDAIYWGDINNVPEEHKI